MDVIIIHGAYGNPEESWFPWLKDELEKLNCKVFIPGFPTPKDQTLQNWINVFEGYKQRLEKDCIVVGHSLGSAFLLTVLERLNRPIKAAFFVSGFAEQLGNKEFDEINRTFVEKSFDWEKIKENCRDFHVFHSDDDPYVSLEKAEHLAKNLSVEVSLVKGAGHFNKRSGYGRFELLLEKIKEKL